MDLRNRKRIKNGLLPCFDGGWEKFKTRWNNGGGEAAMNTVVTGLNAAQLFNSMKYPTNYANDFVGKYGVNNSNSIDGVNYQQYNDINTSAEENRMSKERDSKIMSGASLGATTGLGIGTSIGLLTGAGAATAGAATAGAATGLGLGGWLGPIGAIAGLGLGALFGGIFGNSAKHEEEELMRIAKIKQNNANEFWRTNALSTSLRNKALEQYGDTNRFNLFSGVKDGVENVHTSNGIKQGKPNAKVNDGEIIESKDGKAHVVNGNPNVIDGEYAKLHNGDNVYSSTLTIPGTDITYAQAYPIMKSLGIENELLALQPISREMAQKNRTNNNLIHAWGGLENILATIPGMIQSWRDYNDAANDDIHRTSITPFNPYEKKAAEIMAGRTISPYPQMRAITMEDAAQRYRTNMSGGMSAMQKTMANIASNMGSKVARANALANAQQLRNQYAKESADLLNQMGTSLMNERTRAQMFNEQMNAQAHASQVQQKYMAKRNMLDYATQFAKNAWERNQFDRWIDIYAQQAAADRLKALGGKKYTPTTWSLGGDLSAGDTFEKYAPTPFSPIRDIWATPKQKPFNPVANVDVPFAPTENVMLAKIRKNRKRGRK